MECVVSVNCLAQENESMLKPTPPVKSMSDSGERALALRSLFDAEEGALLRYAFSLVGRRAVAEEIVQEVFLQLHRQWDTVNTPRAWLFRSVRNASYNHLRSCKRESNESSDEVSSTCDHTSETPEAMLVRIETLGTLRESLDELCESDRLLVKLKYFDNLKYRDISEHTGLTISNVGYRLHHILKELGRRLRPLGVDEES